MSVLGSQPRCPVCPCHGHAGRAPHGSKCQEGAGWGQPSAHRNLGLPQTPLPCLNPPGLEKLNSGSSQTCPLPFLPRPFISRTRTQSLLFCFLSLGALLPSCHCLAPKKPFGFLLCPSLFLIPTCIHSSLLVFHPVPIFTFLANIFLPKSLYSLSSTSQPTLL